MNHSPMFEKIKEYYDKGYWGITAVRNAVVKGKLTPDEFKEITGEDYE